MEGRSRKKHHLVPKTYINRKGEEVTTVGLTFNPMLKTKMVGVQADVSIRMGGPYRAIYDDYKERLEHHPKWAETTKLHRHRAARRYMIKMFLLDVWYHWRRLEGLPTGTSYHEGVLANKHAA